MSAVPRRADVLPEPELPHSAALLAEGRALAAGTVLRRAAFQRHYDVGGEHQYKLARTADSAVCGEPPSSNTPHLCSQPKHQQ